VPAREDAYYRGLVETELRALGLSEPPVSVDAVAEHMGVPVRQLELPPWFTAAIVYEDGLPAVLMNARKDPGSQRHALGHVLGHLLVLLNDLSANYPKDTLAVHEDAELIAREFETPAYMVRDQAQKWFNDYRYLAGLFGVSENAMFERMRDLGLIQSRGVLWDY
jgi:Zn-dependent peptidase ImmA (M78 family)